MGLSAPPTVESFSTSNPLSSPCDRLQLLDGIGSLCCEIGGHPAEPLEPFDRLLERQVVGSTIDHGGQQPRREYSASRGRRHGLTRDAPAASNVVSAPGEEDPWSVWTMLILGIGALSVGPTNMARRNMADRMTGSTDAQLQTAERFVSARNPW